VTCDASPHAPTLPKRPDCWHIYYGDVHVGTIARRVGNPANTDSWKWTCGFYPGSQPGEHRHGTGATFDQARADFEAAWRTFLASRTEADFQKWRHARDWHEKKYAMWAAGENLPSQKPSRWSRFVLASRAILAAAASTTGYLSRPCCGSPAPTAGETTL
jgi:hypothetical protein